MLIEKYEDQVEYRERVVEVAFRNGSVETNVSESRVVGVRVFYKGVWSIASTQTFKNITPHQLRSIAYKSLKKRRTRGGCLVEARQYNGKFKMGEEAEVEDLERLLESIALHMTSGEAIVSMYSSWRRIAGDWGESIGENVYYEVLIYPTHLYSGRLYSASSALAFTGRISDLRDKHLEELCNIALESLNAKINSKRLPPILRGKTTLILGEDVSAAFFHEVTHLLEGDIQTSLIRGQRISTKHLSIYDDPKYPWSPSYTVFDDEAVETGRKALVEDGEVIENLHTRESASKFEEATPGNSRGLFHKPKALHRTLIVHPGDWKSSEIIEETRKGILVRGVLRAELFQESVTIIPEIAWIVERGEVKEPVVVREITIPLLVGLTSISAFGRNLKMRHSYEKGHVTAELAPPIRIEGYVF